MLVDLLLSPALPMNLSAASTPANSAEIDVSATELGSLAASESIVVNTEQQKGQNDLFPTNRSAPFSTNVLQLSS
jgi:hypothetical protein